MQYTLHLWGNGHELRGLASLAALRAALLVTVARDRLRDRYARLVACVRACMQ